LCIIHSLSLAICSSTPMQPLTFVTDGCQINHLSCHWMHRCCDRFANNSINKWEAKERKKVHFFSFKKKLLICFDRSNMRNSNSWWNFCCNSLLQNLSTMTSIVHWRRLLMKE
jgi:hypothetical protein